MVDYTIQSILAAVVLDIQLDLNYLKDHLFWPVRQMQPHMLTFRIPEPKATIMIYRSGKIAIAGVKSFNDIKKIKSGLLKELVRIGVSVPQNPELEIWNIVGTADVGRMLDIEDLSTRFYKDSEYLPEIFPGLVYRLSDSSLTVLAFSSGKLVLVGAKRVEDLQLLFDSFTKLIEGNSDFEHQQ